MAAEFKGPSQGAGQTGNTPPGAMGGEAAPASMQRRWGDSTDLALSRQAPAALAESAKLAETDVSPKLRRIHLVDDGEAIRNSIGGWLSRYGYQVETSSDLPDFFRALDGQRPDLVLIDLVLPSGSGLAGLERVKLLDPQLPVVVITGQPSFESAAQALRLGAYDYIPKPVDKSQLLAVVARALRHRHLEREKERLEAENAAYRDHLTELVIERTQQLAASEEKYRLGFIHSLDAICVINRDGRILDANRAAAELSGVSVEALQGRLLGELMAAGIQPAFQDWCARLFSTGISAAERLSLVRPDGRSIPVEVFGTQLGPSIFQTVARDITDRLEAEKILEEKVRDRTRELGQSEERTRSLADELAHKNRVLESSLVKLQELQRFRDNLFHMILHDVRTPLSVATVGLDLVLKGALEMAQADRCRKSRQALMDVGDMLGQMLDIERLEEGRLPVELGAVDPTTEVAAVVTEMADLASMRGLEIEVAAGNLPAVLADVGLLRRILRNLLLNAIRHSRPKSRVVVAATMRQAALGGGGEETPAGIEITVTDSGNGVPTEYAEKIFEKFGAATLRLKYGGAPSVGLGLAFSRLAARAMFGEVHLKHSTTVEPCGSCFALQLRLA